MYRESRSCALFCEDELGSQYNVIGPTDRTACATERSRYEQVAERVRNTSIRCEGCGKRFEELEAYRVHECEVVYR